MIVLKIIGWTLLAILALITIALFIRVKIEVEYSDDKTSVLLKYLFLKIPVYPMPPKEKKPKEKREEEEDEEEEEEEKEEEPEKEKKSSDKESLLHILYRTNGIDGILLIIQRVCSYLKSFFADLLKALVIEELQLNMQCTKPDDAAATAIYYGEVCSVVFPVIGEVASRCKMKTYDINIYPDYLDRFSKASFYLRLHLTPMYLIWITIVLVMRLLFKVLLRLVVKIFMPKKEQTAGNSDKSGKKASQKSNEKREQTV